MSASLHPRVIRYHSRNSTSALGGSSAGPSGVPEVVIVGRSPSAPVNSLPSYASMPQGAPIPDVSQLLNKNLRVPPIVQQALDRAAGQQHQDPLMVSNSGSEAVQLRHRAVTPPLAPIKRAIVTPLNPDLPPPDVLVSDDEEEFMPEPPVHPRTNRTDQMPNVGTLSDTAPNRTDPQPYPSQAQDQKMSIVIKRTFDEEEQGVEQVMDSLDDLQKKYNKERYAHRSLQEDYRSLQDEVEALSSRLSVINTENKSMKRKLFDLEKEVADLTEERDRWELNHQVKLKKMGQTHQLEVVNLVRDRDHEKTHNQNLYHKWEQSEKKVKSLEALVVKLTSAVSGRTDELKTLQETKSQLAKDLEEERKNNGASLQRLEGALARRQTEVAELEESNKKLAGMDAQYRATITSLEGTVKTLVEKNREAGDRQVAEAGKLLEAAENLAVIRTLEEEKRSLLVRMKGLEKELAAQGRDHEQTVNQLKDKLVTAQVDLDVCRRERDEALAGDQEHELLVIANEELLQKINRLEKEIGDRDRLEELRKLQRDMSSERRSARKTSSVGKQDSFDEPLTSPAVDPLHLSQNGGNLGSFPSNFHANPSNNNPDFYADAYEANRRRLLYGGDLTGNKQHDNNNQSDNGGSHDMSKHIYMGKQQQTTNKIQNGGSHGLPKSYLALSRF